MSVSSSTGPAGGADVDNAACSRASLNWLETKRIPTQLELSLPPIAMSGPSYVQLPSLLTPSSHLIHVVSQARQQILSHASANAASLEKIESAIIIISLDSTKPVTREETSWGLWVGDGKDRWFDKHQRESPPSHAKPPKLTYRVAVIVFENGKSGFNGEHSCMDVGSLPCTPSSAISDVPSQGTPTSRLNDWLLRSLDSNKIPLGTSARPLSQLPTVNPITFSLPPSVIGTIATSIEAHDAVMAKHELAVLQYDGYGKDLIKTFKISPDSYTQLVMALAFYKMEGELAPTYESAQTRKYKLGRTEVIRSATIEALEWVKAMEDPSRSVSSAFFSRGTPAIRKLTPGSLAGP